MLLSDYTIILHLQDARNALEGVPSISGMNDKQVDYVMTILDLNPSKNISFRMFGVAAALSERITKME